MKLTIISKHTNGLEHKCSGFNFYYFILVFALFSFSTILNAQIENFQVGSTTRKMLVYAPLDIDSNQPLLISMHGYNQDIDYQKDQTQWEAVAKVNNFVVVYPGGVGNSWDLTGNSDINFILAIIDEMYKRYSIDRNRVYLSGFSMGGMMTYFAATKIADKIAAFAPVSGYMMGGPNTNSSRPIPIIHTHGTTDDVVAYSGVSTCLNAWIKRNGCPTTAQVTQPYPVGKTTGDAKYYWGPGIDSVEIVLISLKNKGHIHSIEANGVNTSQEIWDFCKKFSLDYGIPKLKSATVYDTNPKQIQLVFSRPLKNLTKYEGFTVKVDGQEVAIDTIVMSDSLHLAVNLVNSVLRNSEIQLSYNKGNVVTASNRALLAFSDTFVNNLLYGSNLKLLELAVSEKGDTLVAKFNKKMILPSDISSLALKAEFNGQKNIPLGKCSFLKNDSSIIVFSLKDTVYAEYKLSLSYTGNNIISYDSVLLKNDTNYIVTNKSIGYPVHLISGIVDESAINISLEFSKTMKMKYYQIKQLSLKVNGKDAVIKEVINFEHFVKLELSSNIYYNDTILLTYEPGNIVSADKGVLIAFTNFNIVNPLDTPIYSQIPGKIEAENFTLQYGTDTENTSDTGGGLDVNRNESGDWLVYAIENNTNDTAYKISFRLAAQYSGSMIRYYIDDVQIGTFTVPTTDTWQTFKSTVKDINIPKGKHYLKIFVFRGGFNINYFEIQKDFVSVSKQSIDKISFYPNPAKNNVTIKSKDFMYNKIEISDAMGRTIISKSISYTPEYNLSLGLENGIYMLKISDGKSFYTHWINVIK